MPGTPLTLEYPTTGDTVTEALTKLSDSIEAIETDLEAKVVPGELDMTSSLDMKGNDLLNVGVIELDDTVTATGADPGSIVYAGGEFILVTADGEIALTADGTIDVSTSGGWTGFGGGVSAAYGNGVFNVYEAASDYGTFSGEGIRLQEGNGGTTYVSLLADATVAGTTSYTFADRANASTALLQVTSAGKVTADTTLTGNLTFSGTTTLPTIAGVSTFASAPVFSSGATFNDDVTLGASCQVQIGSAMNSKFIYTGKTVSIALRADHITSGSINATDTFAGTLASSGATDLDGRISFVLDQNEIPTSVSMYCRGNGDANETYDFVLYGATGETLTNLGTTSGTLGSGFSTKTISAGSDYAQSSTTRYTLTFHFGDGTNAIQADCGLYAFSVTCKKIA